MAMKLVHDGIGSTDYEYWQASLSDIDDENLEAGLVKARNWTGFLTLGDFRGLCKKDRTHASYKEHKRIKHQSLPKDELRGRLSKMREELGL